jgi:riboflavin kinase/FMN adenylyltransferase
MQIFRDLADVLVGEPVVLTIGTFDGLHLGHQDVLRQVKQAAQQLTAKTAVIAFHPRPRAVFKPDYFHNDYLTTPMERIKLFQRQGIDVLILIPFSLEFAQISAGSFMRMLTDKINLVQMCVGYDFALGKNREGTISKLTELGRVLNYDVYEIQPFVLNGEAVSSTSIREYLRQGDVHNATRLLGRYPFLTSRIVQGSRRGRTIGFPTANLAVPPERLLPANGVYATLIHLPDDHTPYPSVTNIGVRPSFDGRDRTVEAHIFDFDQNVYDKTVTLEFVERLRPEQKFNGVEELVAQIRKDSAQARRLLADELVFNVNQ